MLSWATTSRAYYRAVAHTNYAQGASHVFLAKQARLFVLNAEST